MMPLQSDRYAPSSSAQQTLQQELLKQKLSSFHLNALLQGDKCVIYEDVNIKIGCIRSLTFEQKPTQNSVLCQFKIFLRNHN